MLAACALAAALTAPADAPVVPVVPVELGAGVASLAGPVVGRESVWLGGAGPSLTLRIGGAWYGQAALDGGLPLAQLDKRGVHSVDGVFLNPMAVASLGAGWRFVDDAITAGAGASVFASVMPYTCGDCFSITGGIGVTPQAFVSWRVLRWLELETRAALAFAPLGLFSDELQLTGTVTAGVVFRYDAGDPWN